MVQKSKKLHKPEINLEGVYMATYLMTVDSGKGKEVNDEKTNNENRSLKPTDKQLEILQLVQNNNLVNLQEKIKESADINFVVQFNNELMSPILLAGINNNLSMIEFLIKKGAQIIKPHVQYFSLIEAARARKFDYKVINAFCSQAKIEHAQNFKSVEIQSRAEILAFTGDIDALKPYIQALKWDKHNKLTTTLYRSFRGTVLVAAACAGNFETTKFIIETALALDGFQLFSTDPLLNVVWEDFKSLISIVIESRNIKFYEFILDWMLKYNSKFKRSIAHGIANAIKHNYQDVLTTTMKHCPEIFYEIPDVVVGDINPLYWWIFKDGNEFAFELMIAHESEYVNGINAPNIKSFLDIITNEGLTLLHISALYSHLALCKRILDLRPEMLYKTSPKGRTPLMKAIQGGAISVIELLLEKDAAQKKSLLQMTDNEHWNVYHFAAGNVDTIKAILKYYPDLELLQARCKDGWTPLNYAIENRRLETVKFLLEHCDPKGVLVSAKISKNTNILHHAATEDGELVKYIVDRKPELLNQRDDEGKNVLMYALNPISFSNNKIVNNQTIAIVQFILTKASNQLLETDKNGKTTLDHLNMLLLYFSQYNNDPNIQKNKDIAMKTASKLRLILFHAYSGLMKQKNEIGNQFSQAVIQTQEIVILDHQLRKQQLALLNSQEMINMNQAMLTMMSNTENQLKDQLNQFKKERTELEQKLGLSKQTKKSNHKGKRTALAAELEPVNPIGLTIRIPMNPDPLSPSSSSSPMETESDRLNEKTSNGDDHADKKRKL